MKTELNTIIHKIDKHRKTEVKDWKFFYTSYIQKVIIDVNMYLKTISTFIFH